MILNYHKVSSETPTKWWVSADSFFRQLSELKCLGLPVLSLDEYLSREREGVVITFDGVYDCVYQYAFPILKYFDFPFELFVIGDHIGGDNEFDKDEPRTKFASIDQIQEMTSYGGRVQWHSKSHIRLRGLSIESLKREIVVPGELKRRFDRGGHFRWFGFPHGDYDQDALDLIKEHYTGAVAVSQADEVNQFNLPRSEVFEKSRFSSKRTKTSIIIPNFNYGRFVEEAIESVYKQTVLPDEVLVIDDCSTDGSQEKIIALQKNYGFKVELNNSNLGIVKNFNKAVSLVTGQYISFLGADNRYRSDFIEHSKFALSHNPKVGVAYTDITIFGPSAHKLARETKAIHIHSSVVEGYSYFRWSFPGAEVVTLDLMRKRNYVHGSSMFRRSAFEQVGGYQPTAGPEDHNFFLRVMEKGWLFSHVPLPVLEYRQHSHAQANTVLNLQRENINLKKINRQLLATLQKLQAMHQ